MINNSTTIDILLPYIEIFPRRINPTAQNLRNILTRVIGQTTGEIAPPININLPPDLNVPTIGEIFMGETIHPNRAICPNMMTTHGHLYDQDITLNSTLPGPKSLDLDLPLQESRWFQMILA